VPAPRRFTPTAPFLTLTLTRRIALSLVAITILLVIPTVYGLVALRDLHQIAQEIRTRDAEGALVLGRLQTALADAENWERVYTALRAEATDERQSAGRRLSTAVARGDSALHRLGQLEYDEAVAPAEAQWERFGGAVKVLKDRVEDGALDEADQVRQEEVLPALDAFRVTLDPIASALDRTGEEQIRRAQTVAAGAVTTTMVGLVIALALAMFVAVTLARSILRPIRDLRGDMATVAEGDFEPESRLSEDREDEIGELVRSFRTMTDRLAELDRLKAEFVSVASHELKTPLSVIHGYLALMQDGIYGELTDEQLQTISATRSQADRLGRLIQQLLDISRFEAGGARLEVREIALEDFLGELAESFQVLAHQNEIDFRLEMGDSVPTSIRGDAERLNEVFGNLLSNAFKFTQRGGRIRLRAAAANGNGVQVEVDDSGVGIPSDKLPRIFEKFFQVDNEAQPRSVGSGLGLAIARELVEAHGGTITADSREGEGTLFRVILPEEPPPPADDAA
jgi:signal transduction histidine kinase